jgi:hypothetical protein
VIVPESYGLIIYELGCARHETSLNRLLVGDRVGYPQRSGLRLFRTLSHSRTFSFRLAGKLATCPSFSLTKALLAFASNFP